MVDTIAILYQQEDVDMYKKGDFRIRAYRGGNPLKALEMGPDSERQPAVFTAKVWMSIPPEVYHMCPVHHYSLLEFDLFLTSSNVCAAAERKVAKLLNEWWVLQRLILLCFCMCSV
jgi:hypothetical protein